MKKLEGKISLVTGAGRGIGKAISLKLAKEGSTVVLNDVDFETLKNTRGEIESFRKEKTIMIKADVSNYNEDKKMVEKILNKFHKIDILVNNAGIEGGYSAEEISLGQWNKMIGVCLNGVFFLSQLVGKEMIKQKSGKIINISSMAGLFAPPFMADYTAAKHGVVGLTKALAIDWAKYNINVNCVCPGLTKTKMVEQLKNKKPEFMKERINRIPLKRLATPEDIANGVLYLASSDSDYVTGFALCIDGGNQALFSGYPVV